MPAEEPTRIMIGLNQSTILTKYPHTKTPASLSSRFAFEWVMQRIVLSNYAGFKLILLNVQVAPELATSERQLATIMDQVNAMRMLVFFTEKCRELGLAYEVLVVKGDQAKAICREAKRVKPDLLVLGNRDLGPYLRIFLKSVSHEVQLDHSDDTCPLLVIKRPVSLNPRYSVVD
ncbi:Universal stress protein A-like protein [Linum grandiflorum]